MPCKLTLLSRNTKYISFCHGTPSRRFIGKQKCDPHNQNQKSIRTNKSIVFIKMVKTKHAKPICNGTLFPAIKRSFPTGGSATGTPQNLRTPFSIKPSKAHFVVITTALSILKHSYKSECLDDIIYFGTCILIFLYKL